MQPQDSSSPAPKSAPPDSAGLPVPDDQGTPVLGNLSASSGGAPDSPLAPAMASTINPVSLPQGMAIPEDASDSDLIEKEWVLKAKDIIGQTQNNPHEQQKAISHFKATYMKKRYNKDIKLTDD